MRRAIHTVKGQPGVRAIPHRFRRHPLAHPLPGCRFKATVRDEKQLRLVEFTSGFIEPNWCELAHTGRAGWRAQGTRRYRTCCAVSCRGRV